MIAGRTTLYRVTRNVKPAYHQMKWNYSTTSINFSAFLGRFAFSCSVLLLFLLSNIIQGFLWIL